MGLEIKLPEKIIEKFIPVLPPLPEPEPA